jgi:hypothetical protein
MLLPGIDRASVNSEHPPKQCYKANETDDTPMCDGIPLTRDQTSGEWQVCSDAKTGMCGDGLNFGIDRKTLPEHDECLDA